VPIQSSHMKDQRTSNGVRLEPETSTGFLHTCAVARPSTPGQLATSNLADSRMHCARSCASTVYTLRLARKHCTLLSTYVIRLHVRPAQETAIGILQCTHWCVPYLVTALITHNFRCMHWGCCKMLAGQQWVHSGKQSHLQLTGRAGGCQGHHAPVQNILNLHRWAAQRCCCLASQPLLIFQRRRRLGQQRAQPVLQATVAFAAAARELSGNTDGTSAQQCGWRPDGVYVLEMTVRDYELDQVRPWHGGRLGRKPSYAGDRTCPA
jgi:hypothetical protein